MKASEAREIAEKNKDGGFNYQRLEVLESIKKRINVGEFELNLGHANHCIRLFEADYVFFESLGYKVTRPIKKCWIPENSNNKEKAQYYTEPAIISW